MTRSELINAIKDRVYMMGSEISPSFPLTSFYTYVDHTYLDIVKMAVKYERHDLISNLVIEIYRKLVEDISPIYDGKVYQIKVNSDQYAQFISGHVSLGESNNYRIPLELFPAKSYSTLTDSSNNIYYSKPKILFGVDDFKIRGVFCSIIFSEYMPQETKDLLEETSSLDFSIKYAKVPKKMEEMVEDESFQVGDLLQKEIINKTSELIVNILSPQIAATQVKTNSLISNL